MRTHHRGPLALPLLAVFSLAVSCTAQPPPANTSPEGGLGAPLEVIDPDAQLVTNAGIFGEPRTIDPQLALLPIEREVALSVFENLLVLDPTALRLTPGAAEALPSVSSDGKTFTFTLRTGVTYSDGTPVTAADFVYGYTRSCDPRTRSQTNQVLFVIVGCEQLAAMDPGAATSELEAARGRVGVRALDDRRIEFTTVEPAPYFPAVTTLVQGMPVRRADVERGESWTQPATYIGNGAFKLAAWDRGQSMLFERNERYRQPAKLKSWKLVMVQDKTVEFAGYLNEEIHVIEVTNEEMRAVDADPALRAQLTNVPMNCTSYYAFNVTRAPFDDPMVRLAFAKSLDRADFVQKVLGGIGRPADRGFIPPGHPGHDATDSAQAFDPAAAKRLLAGSTYGGSVPPITLGIWATQVNQLNAQWARQQWRANLGVEVTVETIEALVYLRVIESPQTAPEIFFQGWCSDIPDAHNFHATAWGTGGTLASMTGYSDREVDAALLKAVESRTSTVMADHHLAAGKLISSDAPAAWLYHTGRAALVKPYVKGVRPSALGVTTLGKNQIYMIKTGAGATPAAAASPRAPTAAPTAAPWICPSCAGPGAIRTGSSRYDLPLGYSIWLLTGWQRSESQSHTEPVPGGDPENVASDVFTRRSYEDDRDAHRRSVSGAGPGPAGAHTVWVRIYRNSEAQSVREFAETNAAGLGPRVTLIQDVTMRDPNSTGGGRPATRVHWEWPDGETSFATYVEDAEGRIWAIGFSLAMSKEDVPPGATGEDLRWIVGNFLAPWLR